MAAPKKWHRSMTVKVPAVGGVYESVPATFRYGLTYGEIEVGYS